MVKRKKDGKQRHGKGESARRWQGIEKRRKKRADRQIDATDTDTNADTHKLTD